MFHLSAGTSLPLKNVFPLMNKYKFGVKDTEKNYFFYDPHLSWDIISFYIFIGEQVQDRQMEAIITFTNDVLNEHH